MTIKKREWETKKELANNDGDKEYITNKIR